MMPWISKKELDVLRGISDEYNAWIKYHHQGRDYDAFLAEQVMPKLEARFITKTEARVVPNRVPACSDLNFHCTFPECGCNR